MTRWTLTKTWWQTRAEVAQFLNEDRIREHREAMERMATCIVVEVTCAYQIYAPTLEQPGEYCEELASEDSDYCIAHDPYVWDDEGREFW